MLLPGKVMFPLSVLMALAPYAHPISPDLPAHPHIAPHARAVGFSILTLLPPTRFPLHSTYHLRHVRSQAVLPRTLLP